MHASISLTYLCVSANIFTWIKLSLHYTVLQTNAKMLIEVPKPGLTTFWNSVRSIYLGMWQLPNAWNKHSYSCTEVHIKCTKTLHSYRFTRTCETLSGEQLPGFPHPPFDSWPVGWSNKVEIIQLTIYGTAPTPSLKNKAQQNFPSGQLRGSIPAKLRNNPSVTTSSCTWHDGILCSTSTSYYLCTES